MTFKEAFAAQLKDAQSDYKLYFLELNPKGWEVKAINQDELDTFGVKYELLELDPEFDAGPELPRVRIKSVTP